MPTYAYRCNDCGTDFKAFHGVDDKQPGCVKCLSVSVQRVYLPFRVAQVAGDSGAQRRVEKFIEESRESLQEQLKEVTREYEK